MSEAAESIISPQNMHELATPAPAEKRRYLVNAPVDLLFIGGASVLTFLYGWFVCQQQPVSYQVATTIFYLAFFVNFPHFLLSYQLLYWDFRRFIFRKASFFWVAVVVPVILAGSLLLTARIGHQQRLGIFVNTLYFFVGWHYVKQIFGGMIVTNALQNYFYKPDERRILELNLYSVWLLSWVNSNVGLSHDLFYGVSYETLGFPPILFACAYVFTGVTFLALLISQLRKYAQERRLPTLASVVCYVSIYLWFLPSLYNPTFFYTVSFFHSLQYLPFVYAFRRNKVAAEPGGKKMWGKHGYFLNVYSYLLLSVITGAIFFWFLPNYIDNQHLFNADLYSPTLAMFSFMIFLNVHHYFIDNVMWKGNNPEMRRYIFQTGQPT